MSRYQNTLDEAKARILSETGSSRTSAEVLALAADVSDPKDIEQVVAKVIEKYGHLDVAIANAAIGGSWDKRKFHIKQKSEFCVLRFLLLIRFHGGRSLQ